MAEMMGAKALVEALKRQKVEVIFGIPGAVSYTHLKLPTNREV